MLEIIGLKKRCRAPMYVHSTSLRSILAESRIYMVSEADARTKEKLIKDGKLNSKEIKHRITEKVQEKAKFSKEWKLKPEDADEYAGVLFDWANTMNGDIATFIERKTNQFKKYHNIDETDPKRRIDLSQDAQLMRYAAGAGLEVNFHPFKGNLHDERDQDWIKRVKRGVKAGEFSIKANAKASFAIAEGRVRTECYLPHFAGFHVTPNIGGQQFELGYMRIYADIVLYGSVGASLALETDILLSYEGGKQGLRGVPPQNRNRLGVKVRSGMKGELDVFAGGRLGIDLQAAVQWLNPEGDASDGQPGKVKPGEAIAEYKTFAMVGAGVAVAAGAGIKGAFEISIENDRFIVRAKLGACLGLGGDGNVKAEVSAGTIAEFFKFTAYQLKRIDYHKLSGFIADEAFTALTQTFYLIIAKGTRLIDYAQRTATQIQIEYIQFSGQIESSIKSGSNFSKRFLDRMEQEFRKKTASWFVYAPPEVAGQLHRQIAEFSRNNDPLINAQVPRLLSMALGACQTENQLITIAERMTPTLGAKQDSRIGLKIIRDCLIGSPFEKELANTEQLLRGVEKLNSKPFIWNNDAEFIAAKMHLEDGMYS